MNDAPSAPPSVDLEAVRCLCGEEEMSVLFSARDRLHNLPGSFQVVRCNHCGLMRTNPRPTRSSIGYYYPRDYQPYAETDPEGDGLLYRVGRTLFDSLATKIPSMVPGKLLEIGAASGNYLLQMVRAGWSVQGIEFDAEAAHAAGTRTGANMHLDSVENVVLAEKHFDLVCAWMTIEHLHDPAVTLRKSFSWLKPGGWIALSVPDCSSWQFRLFRQNWFALQLPAHLFHFTPATLRTLLGAAGFEAIQVRWQRTLYDVPMSVAFWIETWAGPRAAVWTRRAANSVISRGLSRLLGVVCAPLELTGRLTVWAHKPE